MKKTTTAMLVLGVLAFGALAAGTALDPDAAAPGVETPAKERAGNERAGNERAGNERAAEVQAPGAKDAPKTPRERLAAARAERKDREAIRARLEQRLQDAARLKEGIEDLIKRLDEGAGPGEIVRESEKLRTIAREFAALPGRGGGNAGAAGDGAGKGREGQGRGDGEVVRPRVQEQRERAQKFLDTHMPTFAERMRQAKDRRLVDSVLSKVAPRVDEFEKIQKETPDQFQPRLQELRLGIFMVEKARQLSIEAGKPRPDETQVSRLEAELTKLTGDMFDVRARIQALEIKAIEDRVAASRRELERMKNNRDKVVQERAENMIRRAKAAGR